MRYIFPASMKRFFLLFFLASCSLSQQERVAEDVAPLQSPYELRQERFVINSIGNPPAPFSLRLEPDFTLTADGIPMNERFVLASFDPLKKTAMPFFEFETLPDKKLAFFTPAGEPIAEMPPIVLKDYLKGQTVYLAAISKKNPTCNKVAWSVSSRVRPPKERRRHSSRLKKVNKAPDCGLSGTPKLNLVITAVHGLISAGKRPGCSTRTLISELLPALTCPTNATRQAWFRSCPATKEIDCAVSLSASPASVMAASKTCLFASSSLAPTLNLRESGTASSSHSRGPVPVSEAGFSDRTSFKILLTVSGCGNKLAASANSSRGVAFRLRNGNLISQLSTN